MVLDAGAASGWSKLKHLHKTVSKRGEIIDLNTGSVLSKILFLMLGSTGIPLCQELFISSRYATGNKQLNISILNLNDYIIFLCNYLR